MVGVDEVDDGVVMGDHVLEHSDGLLLHGF